MASGVYNRFKYNLFAGLVDLAGSGSHTIKVGLLTSSHSFVAANNTWTAISGNETSGTGYTAGGATLASKTITQVDGSNLAMFDADDTTWSTSTITAAFAVVYDSTLLAKDLIACYDFGGNQSSSAGNFTIQWNASGLITLS